MNFKRIEIYGFKSFADKTVVEFNDGITGIVGPNGSGKSNFSDAIKWVLGEQSAKALRGKNMLDVIFAGTQRRPSLSYCEVVLVFDNTNKIFPSLEFEEVSIGRKLYKNGESDYSINNITCRLRDIKDIIRDTGLGKDGYSIIGQGRVEEIINAKPENRRTIFEEAAGISKYKNRKVESENKLTRTREHLDRLQDIIREIERRLSPLEKQSNDAKKYYEYYNQLRDLEVNHYLFTCDNNKVIKDKINSLLKGISEEIAKIETDKIEQDALYNKKLIEIQVTDTNITSYREARTNLLLENQKKLGQGELLSERLKNLKAELSKLEQNIARNNMYLAEKQGELKVTEIKEKELTDDLSKIKQKYEDTQNIYNSIVDEIIARENEIESSNRAMLDALDKLTDVKADMSKLSAELEHLKEKKNELEELIVSRKKAIEEEEKIKLEITKKIEVLRIDRDKTYASLVNVRNKSNELKLEQNLLNNTIRNLTASMSAFEAKRKVLEDVKNSYENFQMPIKRLMQECKNDPVLDSKILGVIAEIIKVPEKLETAIEVSLGAALQNVVTATDIDVKYIIEVLKRKKMGIITFLPINSMRPRRLGSEQLNVLKEDGCIGIASKIIEYNSRYENVISNLLGATIICDNYDNALRIARKYNRAFKIVTLEGDVLSTQGSITGGSRKIESGGILSQERSAEQALQLYNKTKEDYNAKIERLKIVDIEYEESVNRLKELEELLRNKEVMYSNENNKENECIDKIDKYLEDLEKYSENYNIACDSIDMISRRLTGTDKLESDIKTERLSMDDQKSKSKLLFDAKNEEKEKLSKDLTALRMQIVELESRLNNVGDDIERCNKEIIAINETILEDSSVIDTIKFNIAETESKINGAELSEKDKQKLDAIIAKIKEAEEYKQTLNDNIIEINIAKDKCNKDLQNAIERKIKEENNIDKLDSQFMALTQRLQEEYDIDHEKALTMKIEDFDDEGVITEIANLKRNITKLGTINTGAIEEYISENARYTELTTERDDLLKAENDLMSIIKDLSKEMQEIFDIEFSRISQHFEQTFKDIFGGGQGKLLLDKNAEDPLEAGIEILAQPPGKKLGQMTLFSGGEKALTAIAILFAILKSKPMPFCVLDEIEAALDESNARLFAKYLKKFVGDTQFIVITHRKPTMEQADRLYGVTMEEKGVSKIVSVQLNEAVNTINDKK